MEEVQPLTSTQSASSVSKGHCQEDSFQNSVRKRHRLTKAGHTLRDIFSNSCSNLLAPVGIEKITSFKILASCCSAAVNEPVGILGHFSTSFAHRCCMTFAHFCPSSVKLDGNLWWNVIFISPFHIFYKAFHTFSVSCKSD